MNTLYYGDNLDVLRLHVKDESAQLVYLDPPFKSDQDYNVLFAERDGSRSAAQIKAFEDTWQWDQTAAQAYHEVVERSDRVSLAMVAFHQAIGENDMLAYLSMMAPRLVELHRVLKENGSIWLHCDPTASHYLKILMDAVFGPESLRNEIIWQRSTSKSHAFTRFPAAHDVLLYYGKGDAPTWNPQYLPHREEYIKSHYANVEEGTGRRYTLGDCLNPNRNRPNLTYEWNGITRVWRWTKDKMQSYHDEGRLHYTRSGMPRFKRYLDEMPGTPVTSVWTDIFPINSQAQERLGYPTQKPEALLERIINASSNEGDVVLDPFCGCETAIAAAEKLHRRWVGIDITYLATTLIKSRLSTAFGGSVAFEIVGEPTDLAGAKALADSDPYQFQWWALGLVNARPTEQKKGADKGIDGRIFFHDEWAAGGGKTKQIILSVKAGHTNVAHVRDLRGVLDREKAPIGVLITMEEPTRPMRQEAATAGFYKSPWSQEDYPKLQILTVEELLAGKKIDAPPQRGPEFKAAPKARRKPSHRQKELGE